VRDAYGGVLRVAVMWVCDAVGLWSAYC
jgi:hypothetical protein